jgi:hypothetical protein
VLGRNFLSTEYIREAITMDDNYGALVLGVVVGGLLGWFFVGAWFGILGAVVGGVVQMVLVKRQNQTRYF